MEWQGAFFQPARVHALDWALRLYADPSHRLFRRAVKTERPMMITLKERKVYVGFVWELTELRLEHEFIAVLQVGQAGHDPSSLLHLAGRRSGCRRLPEVERRIARDGPQRRDDEQAVLPRGEFRQGQVLSRGGLAAPRHRCLSRAWPGPTRACPGLVRACPGLVRAWPGLVRAWPGPVRAWAGPVRACPGLVRACPGPVRACPGLTRACPGLTRAWAGPVRAWLA